jgi:TPR repeat protein
MRTRMMKAATLLALCGLCTTSAIAGPFEDGAAAYKRGNYAAALSAWRPIANTNGEVQNIMGIMYMDGKGVPRNAATALQWFARSAASGSSSGQNNLGGLYRDGKGVPRDFDKAFTFFYAGASQGTRVDHLRAYMWFDLAAMAGYPRGAADRQVERAKLTTKDAADAHQMALQCKANNFKKC